MVNKVKKKLAITASIPDDATHFLLAISVSNWYKKEGDYWFVYSPHHDRWLVSNFANQGKIKPLPIEFVVD